MAMTARVTGPLILHLTPPLARISDDAFFEFCQANPELRIEQTSEGHLVIGRVMSLEEACDLALAEDEPAAPNR